MNIAKLEGNALKIAVVAGIVLAIYVARKGLKGAAAAVTNAAVNVATGAATGVVEGVGSAVGVPLTDAQKCQQAIAAGNHFDASLYCDAGTFLSSMWPWGDQASTAKPVQPY